MISPCWLSVHLFLLLSVCSLLITSAQTNRFHEIQQERQAIGDDLSATLFNLVILTITKWRTSKRLRWIQNFGICQRETMNFYILMELTKMNNFYYDHFCERPKI
jgi:hypothetical protein